MKDYPTLNDLIKAYTDIKNIKAIYNENKYSKEECFNKIINLLGLDDKDNDSFIGKWIAFTQEGMEPILHGKIINISYNGTFTIRCKNGEHRYASYNSHSGHILAICDTKQECYKIK